MTTVFRRTTAKAVFLSVVVQLSCESKPREVYEIPAGYRGWVEVRAKRAGCPPLQRTPDAVIFAIPAGGVLCTSSSISAGLGREEYFYVDNRTRSRLRDSAADQYSMIWKVEFYGSGGAGPDLETKRDRLRFFVGTKGEFEAMMARAANPR